MRVFTETQRFDQWWMKLLMGIILGILVFCLYNWFVIENAIDKVSPNDTFSQIMVTLIIVSTLLLLYLIKLRTEIDEIGIHYRFSPFHFSRKTIRWNELEKCYVREYNPIREYGGWGYRASFGKKGHAYNVKGNIGVQLEFKNGKNLLIGTQKEIEATQVINRYFNRQI